MKKYKKSIKIGLLIIGLLLISFGGYYGYTKIYLPSQQEVSVLIYKENNELIDEITFKKDSYLQVLDENAGVVYEYELNSETENIVIEEIESPDNLLLDTWELEKKVDEATEFYKSDETYFVAKPVYVDKEDYVLTFIADEKANVLYNEQEVDYIRKPYTIDTPLNDYLPEINVEEDFKGNWVIEDTIIDEDTEIEADTVIEFKSYH